MGSVTSLKKLFSSFTYYFLYSHIISYIQNGASLQATFILYLNSECLGSI